MISSNLMILGNEAYYSLDDRETLLNNNVLVIGTSGSGKTRNIVTPNLLQAVGSYILVDPKGNLYDQFSQYLRGKGYDVKKLNFIDPSDCFGCSYNFFEYIRSDQDILKIAHMITTSSYDRIDNRAVDPFWDDAAELLLTAVIGHLYHHCPKEEQNLKNIITLINEANPSAQHILRDKLGRRILDGSNGREEDFAVRKYQSFLRASDRTAGSIIIVLASKMAIYDTPDIQKMLQEDTVDIGNIGKRNTALFVQISDTDRSMDKLAGIFFSQTLNELCRVADNMPSSRLPINVRFVLDDFATNLRISDFPGIISSIRSRGISAMIMIQAESQLSALYGEYDCRTIIANCDTQIYLGGNDADTARNIAIRLDVPLSEVLYMPLGCCWIFRRGELPREVEIFELEPFLEEKMEEIVFDDPELV